MVEAVDFHNESSVQESLRCDPKLCLIVSKQEVNGYIGRWSSHKLASVKLSITTVH